MSVFDVMGPVMIGPSSSHTAGGVKIGLLARLVLALPVEEAEILLHGSFAETYQGHGTDRAIVGGILGFKPDDENIRNSLVLAEKKGIKVSFRKSDLGDVHPNTALIRLRSGETEIAILGSSIGGGDILVIRINDYQVSISGKFPTLWVLHKDRPGKVALITSILGEHDLNIAFMQVFRKKKGTIGSSIIELDQEVSPDIIEDLEKRDGIIQARYIPAL